MKYKNMQSESLIYIAVSIHEVTQVHFDEDDWEPDDDEEDDWEDDDEDDW